MYIGSLSFKYLFQSASLWKVLSPSAVAPYSLQRSEHLEKSYRSDVGTNIAGHFLKRARTGCACCNSA